MHRIRLLTLSIVLLVTGCTVGPDYQPPSKWEPTQWGDLPHGDSTLDDQPKTESKTSPGPSVPITTAAFDPKWWACFDDPVLEDLEQRAADENLDVRRAIANIIESRAQRRVAAAGFYPNLSADASAERQKASQGGELGLISSAPGSTSTNPGTTANGSYGSGAGGLTGPSNIFSPLNLVQDGVEVSWQLDLFGSVRRSVESADATVVASRDAERGMRLSVASEVATNYINLRNAQASLTIARDLLRTAADTRRVTEDRVLSGLGSQADLETSVALEESLRAQISQYESAAASSSNALTLLLAVPPGALTSELGASTDVPKLLGPLPIGLPSDVVRFRPDILQADATLHSAVANVGVAKADFYPSVSLSASGGFQAMSVAGLGSWNNRQFAFGPTLSLPIFDGGQLKGTLQLREAQAQDSAFAYQKTVLNAWQEVDTGLATLESEGRRHDALVRQSSAAERAFVISRDRYKRGLGTFLSVLDAERTLLNAQLQCTASQAALASDAVQLYRAVGGGWSAKSQTVDSADS